MRFGNSGFNRNYAFYGPEAFSGAVRPLVIINIFVFVLINVFPSVDWYGLFGLVPEFIFKKLMLWQLVTYLFVHAGIWHLALNMLMLWMFGSVIENVWGPKRFLFYYFLTGIGAGLFSVLFSFSSPVPVVGASGAIFGLLVAFGLMFPENIILLFFIFPMKMKYAVIVLGLINLMGALSNAGSGIAYLAHVGGGLIGYLYLKNESLRFKFARFRMPELRRSMRTGTKPFRPQEHTSERPLDEEIDRILDKISSHGMESLTREEREMLKKKSRAL